MCGSAGSGSAGAYKAPVLHCSSTGASAGWEENQASSSGVKLQARFVRVCVAGVSAVCGDEAEGVGLSGGEVTVVVELSGWIVMEVAGCAKVLLGVRTRIGAAEAQIVMCTSARIAEMFFILKVRQGPWDRVSRSELWSVARVEALVREAGFEKSVRGLKYVK